MCVCVRVCVCVCEPRHRLCSPFSIEGGGGVGEREKWGGGGVLS